MDTLFYNGVISTLDDDDRTVEAIGIDGGIIKFLGTNKEAESLSFEEKIDLQNKFMLPGFVDSHMHLINYAFVESSVKLFECVSVSEAIEKARKYLNDCGENKPKWLYCRGWNEENFADKKYPSKEDLDSVSLDIPIIFVRVCGHLGICNTYALNKFKDIKEFEDVKHQVDFDKGTLKESAVQLFYSILEKPDQTIVEGYIKLGMKDLNALGITGCQTDDFASIPGKDWKLIVNSYQNLQKRNEMTVRIYEQCLFERLDEFKEFLKCGMRTGQGGEFFRIGPLKLLEDGSLGAKTAALSKHYENDDSNIGMAIFTQSELDEIVSLAHSEGMQIAVHCIGDRAMRMTVDAIKKVGDVHDIRLRRHGIVHAQIASGTALQDMKENNIMAYIQPVFVDTDMDITESRLGKYRNDSLYAWKTMLDMGIHISGGSDAPVVSFNVMENIYFAVTRMNMCGKPARGWLPKEKLSVKEAVRLFTKYPGYASFTENTNGTLEIGKKADLVVISDNIYDIAPEKIKNIEIERTVLDGKTIYLKS